MDARASCVCLLVSDVNPQAQGNWRGRPTEKKNKAHHNSYIMRPNIILYNFIWNRRNTVFHLVTFYNKYLKHHNHRRLWLHKNYDQSELSAYFKNYICSTLANTNNSALTPKSHRGTQTVAIGPRFTMVSMFFMASNLGSLAWNFSPA